MYKDGFYRHRIVALFAIIMIVAVGLAGLPSKTPTQTKSAKFVLAGWDYPDEYGQGVYRLIVEQWTNGAWADLTGGGVQSGDSTTFNITNGEGSNGTLRINVHCYLNGTLTGISDVNDGPALIRHTITVSTTSNSSVFYQANFTLTYQTDALAPMYFYQYEVKTDFLPIDGIIYTATITYEVFY